MDNNNNNMDTNNIVKIVAQTGLAGICVLLIVVCYKLASEHVVRNTEAIIGVEKAITEISKVVENNTAIIKEFKR